MQLILSLYMQAQHCAYTVNVICYMRPQCSVNLDDIQFQILILSVEAASVAEHLIPVMSSDG